MKTIKELSPEWTKYIEEHENIPRIMTDVEINGHTARIGNPACCFVGEARGGGCYYDPQILKDGIEKHSANLEDYIVNPNYCEPCAKMSQAFFDMSESWHDHFNNEAYKTLCEAYAKHYNEAHNGDRCEE